MCGIGGVFHYQGSRPVLDWRELELMSDAMKRRGPDGAGLWIAANGEVGFSHRRLSIIDLSEGGAQPMTDTSGRVTIVYNGEIYNYAELRNQLEKDGVRFRTQSDTEVMLELYLSEGDGFVDKLRGMFAFGLWDESRKRLLLGRDHFGIKPLYYSDKGGFLRFASQVKALIAGGGIETTLDPAGVVGFWLWGNLPEPYTLYKEIRSLPPGSLLSVERGRTPALKRYCDVVALLREPQPKSHPDPERLRELLSGSVRHHLVADVPVGAFLSAGRDSTTLCALAMEQVKRPLRTVTLGFEEYRGTAADEAPLAAEVARVLGTEHQTRWISRKDFQDTLPNVLEAMDQPTVDGLNTYFVSKITAQAGLKVAFSGVGGDEFFGGYPSFKQIPTLVRQLSWLPFTNSVGRGFRWVSAPMLKHLTSPKYAGLLEYGATYGGAYLLRRALFMPWELPEFLDGELVREGWRELQTMSNLDATTEGQPTAFCMVSALETAWYLQNRLLRDADWAGMAHSLEIRTPLVDIELFKRLVPFMQDQQGLTKPSLVSTTGNRLPNTVKARAKTGFSVPVRDWLMSAGGIDRANRGLRGWAFFVGKRFGLECVA